MTPGDWPNLVSMFLARARAGGEHPFLWSKHGGAWRSQSWAQVAGEVSAFSRGLRALGVAPGDRVVLFAENRPNWVIADLAIMAAGAVTVSAYATGSEDDLGYLVTHSGARAVIVSTARLARRLAPALAGAEAVRAVIAMEPIEAMNEGVPVVLWHEALARGRERADDVAETAARIDRRDLACIIYTSGTGGRPKGVMLSHRAILANVQGARRHLAAFLGESEVFLSFLPLSHSYEHTAGLFFPIALGAQIYFAEGGDRLAANMVEVRPTLITCVPRLYEILRHRILVGVRRAGGLRARLFAQAVALGRRRYEAPASLGPLDRLADRILDRLVRDAVRARFGGRLKALVSGGAPLNYDVGLFFGALGLRLLQGYGQTEAAPVVTVNPPDDNRIDSVGKPLPGVTLRIAEDGEILVRGDLVMDGYWRDPEASAAVLTGGWLHTGDIGTLDDDGFLRITDRKKDIIVNSGGDNVSPQRIEGLLGLEPEIAEAMVYGDRRPHLVALIVPADEIARANPGGGKALRRRVAEAVRRVNARLSVIERVKDFALADEPFTIENGEMTPTLKIRRHVIAARYRDRLEGLY